MNLPPSVHQATAPYMASCTPQLHSPKATLLPTIHWNCQICQTCENSVTTPRNQLCLMPVLHWTTNLLSQSHRNKLFLSPANIILQMHYTACSAYQIGLHNHRNTQQNKQLNKRQSVLCTQMTILIMLKFNLMWLYGTYTLWDNWCVTYSRSTGRQPMRRWGGMGMPVWRMSLQ
jgi:hypothetical protein